MKKICVNCNKEFETKNNADHCSFKCMTEWMNMQYGEKKNIIIDTCQMLKQES